MPRHSVERWYRRAVYYFPRMPMFWGIKLGHSFYNPSGSHMAYPLSLPLLHPEGSKHSSTKMQFHILLDWTRLEARQDFWPELSLLSIGLFSVTPSHVFPCSATQASRHAGSQMAVCSTGSMLIRHQDFPEAIKPRGGKKKYILPSSWSLHTV